MIHSCPSRSLWREWLHGRLDSAERSDLAVHLEGCLRCQRQLDELAGDDRAWSDLAREAFTAAPPEPGFARALNELKDRPPAVTVDSSPSHRQSSDDPAHPGKLDGYEILSEVGRGGMGVVLKAFDPKLRRVVAIKVLAPHLAANAAARERFLREARAAAAVAHEHVVSVYSVCESAGAPYLVMQYVGGRSLQDRLDRDGPLTTTEVLRIGMQTALGLAAAHAQGLVHRDVKPANILLENGVERVKLADFGLARAADDASLTRSGVITGSPQFMSPEQASGERVDYRSDLFSLGGVLYAMCAGHPPFRAPSALAVLKRVCDDDPRPLHEVNSNVPDWLEEIVFKLLAKEPADRFASADEVAELLEQHLRHLQQPRSAAPPPALRPRVAPKPHSAIWIVAACALVMILACAGLPLALFLYRGGMSSDVSAVQSAVAVAERNVFDVLTDRNAPELAPLQRSCAIESADYSPVTRTVTWTGTTRNLYATDRDAQADMQQAIGPFRFFDRRGQELGSFKAEVSLGRRDRDGRYRLYLKLKLTDEIVNEAARFEVDEQ